jgi:hypothetical protein
MRETKAVRLQGHELAPQTDFREISWLKTGSKILRSTSRGLLFEPAAAGRVDHLSSSSRYPTTIGYCWRFVSKTVACPSKRRSVPHCARFVVIVRHHQETPDPSCEKEIFFIQSRPQKKGKR